MALKYFSFFDCWTHQIFVLINLQSDDSREYFIIFFFIFFCLCFWLAVQYCFSDRDYDGDCRKTPEYSVAIQLYTVRFYNYIYYQRYLNVKTLLKNVHKSCLSFFPIWVFRFCFACLFFFVLFICFFIFILKDCVLSAFVVLLFYLFNYLFI